MVEEMKIWLLSQKQTQHWTTSKATADACYALLVAGKQGFLDPSNISIALGNKVVQNEASSKEAGTGYLKVSIPGQEVQNEMGKIKVQVSGKPRNSGISWGAVYWQYFEDLDKVSSAANSLQVQKELYIQRQSDSGPVLTPITAENELQVGDKVKVRILIKTDRNLEYVHLKDQRSGCFEPLNTLSGYRFQGQLGFYESSRDVSSHFFIDYLPKGTHIIEYSVFVSQQGNFSVGLTHIQCMYAPEFSAHSDGFRLQVK